MPKLFPSRPPAQKKKLIWLLLLYWSEYLHDFIVLHRAHSRLLVSIQRYFSVAINYIFIVLHRAHSRLLVSIQRYFGSVLKNDDTSLFFTSINYHLKKTCVKILFLVYIHCLYIGKWYNSMYIFNNHFLHR